jgi:hypothetical protein
MWRYGDKEGYRGPAWSGGREELEAVIGSANNRPQTQRDANL